MTSNQNETPREHNEAPAEGDPDADSTGLRVHTQEPAEGEDDDAHTGGSGADKG
ncbi:MAG: hypothetical protein JWO93_2599 [Micrococcaceae bacterium]|nr:hypothetical protein [Micrococcaceae bacterium]